MKITKIERLNTSGSSSRKPSNRYIVHLIIKDEELTIALYGGELHRFKLEEDAELPDSVYEEIVNSVLKIRAKSRCEYLLTRKNYTSAEISKKLEEGYYPNEVIINTLRFLTEYGFIDDRFYAKRYIENHGRKKSIRQIRIELFRKGLDREMVDDLLEELSFSETGALKNLCDRRLKNADLSDTGEWNRQFRFLLSKGFCYYEIKSELMSRKESG